MIIRCDKCSKQYKVDSSKITEKGVKITCPSCGHSLILRRKKEDKTPTPTKMKTPPCAICGSPSTRVLQGDPPQPLCEICFEKQKEKRRRFEVGPYQTQMEIKQGKGEPQRPFEPQIPKIDTEATIPSADIFVSPPKMEKPKEEVSEDYFDSFDEIPDLGDIQPQFKTGTKPESERPTSQKNFPGPGPSLTQTTPRIDEDIFEQPKKEAMVSPEVSTSKIEEQKTPVPHMPPSIPEQRENETLEKEKAHPPERLAQKEELVRSLEQELEGSQSTERITPPRFKPEHRLVPYVISGIILAVAIAGLGVLFVSSPGFSRFLRNVSSGLSGLFKGSKPTEVVKAPEPIEEAPAQLPSQAQPQGQKEVGTTPPPSDITPLTFKPQEAQPPQALVPEETLQPQVPPFNPAESTQEHVQEIIKQVQKPLSQVRSSTPISSPYAPRPGSLPPARPPEEAP